MKKFDEDGYRDRQLNKYLDDYDENLSNCCDAPICGDSDICCECKEHCVSHADEAEMARDDAGDAKFEQAREERHER